MNKIYRVIWNSTLMQWVVTSELGRGKIKRAVSKSVKAAGLIAALSTGAVVAPVANASTTPCGTNDCSDLIFTPGTANNDGMSFIIDDNGTYNLDGTISFTGSTPNNSKTVNLIWLFNNGYTSGQSADPTNFATLDTPTITGVSLLDPATNIATVISTGGSFSFNNYKPSLVFFEPSTPGAGAFIDSNDSKYNQWWDI